MCAPWWDELQQDQQGSVDEHGEPAAPGGSSSGGGSGAAADEADESKGFEEGAVANLLFFGVLGQQTRAGDAPSWFNAVEVCPPAQRSLHARQPARPHAHTPTRTHAPARA